MPAIISKDLLVQEGRDAVVEAFRREERTPPPCPYRRYTKRALFWRHGADKAEAIIGQLMKIGT